LPSDQITSLKDLYKVLSSTNRLRVKFQQLQ